MILKVQLPLSLLFHIKDYLSYKKKLTPFQLSSRNFHGLLLSYIRNRVFPCFNFFRVTKLKKMSSIFCVIFRTWSLLKNDQHWKAFQMIYNMTMVSEKNVPYLPVRRHNILYLTWYLIFPAFWSHSVLLKIGQYAKSNLMIHNLGMLGKTILVVNVNYDVISI